MIRRRPLLLLAGLLCAAPAAGLAQGKARPTLTLPVDLAVARCDGGTKPVKPAAWVEAQVRSANAIFSPHGVVLVQRPRSFSPGRCDLVTRAHRHKMAHHVPARGATVLLLRKIRDIDVPSYDLMGVHWRYKGKARRLRGRRWVMITTRAIRPIMAHELCHYLGLRHDPAGGNLMTPGPSSPLWKRKEGKRPKPFKAVLTGEQGKKLYRAVRRFLKRGKRH